MTNPESADWPGVALVAQLPRLRRQHGQQVRGKATWQQISRLTVLKRFVQARIHEVARVLRIVPPQFQINHHGQTMLNQQLIPLDLSQVEAIQNRTVGGACPLTLLRALLAGLFAHILKKKWLQRLLPTAQEYLGSIADFLSGYVLAAFQATFETRRAFLREIVPLPEKQNSHYQERISAFEQGQLAFQPCASP